MTLPSPRSSLSLLFAAAFALTSISGQAETRCPGNVTGLRPRIVAGALLVIELDDMPTARPDEPHIVLAVVIARWRLVLTVPQRTDHIWESDITLFKGDQ